MKTSAKTEYACIAMIELAASYDQGLPVRVRTIAERNGIPSRFLVQILLQLKGAGLVTSVRGASGGYRLRVPPARISLGQVMAVIDGRASFSNSTDRSSPAGDVLMERWRAIEAGQRALLDATTLADLADRLRTHREPMYYI